MSLQNARIYFPLALFLAGTLAILPAFGLSFSGAIFTTTKHGTAVDQNLYVVATDVYLNGGPQNKNNVGLPNGTYYFQVTDPSGAKLLSTDNAVCRQLVVKQRSSCRSCGTLPTRERGVQPGEPFHNRTNRAIPSNSEYRR